MFSRKQQLILYAILVQILVTAAWVLATDLASQNVAIVVGSSVVSSSNPLPVVFQ